MVLKEVGSSVTWGCIALYYPHHTHLLVSSSFSLFQILDFGPPQVVNFMFKIMCSVQSHLRPALERTL